MKLPAKIANWPQEWRELYEERAGIMEYEGKLSRYTAEIRAEQDTRRTFENQSPTPRPVSDNVRLSTKSNERT